MPPPRCRLRRSSGNKVRAAAGGTAREEGPLPPRGPATQLPWERGRGPGGRGAKRDANVEEPGDGVGPRAPRRAPPDSPRPRPTSTAGVRTPSPLGTSNERSDGLVHIPGRGAAGRPRAQVPKPPRPLAPRSFPRPVTTPTPSLPRRVLAPAPRRAAAGAPGAVFSRDHGRRREPAGRGAQAWKAGAARDPLRERAESPTCWRRPAGKECADEGTGRCSGRGVSR